MIRVTGNIVNCVKPETGFCPRLCPTYTHALGSPNTNIYKYILTCTILTYLTVQIGENTFVFPGDNYIIERYCIFIL